MTLISNTLLVVSLRKGHTFLGICNATAAELTNDEDIPFKVQTVVVKLYEK
jgi:hypothetical protein